MKTLAMIFLSLILILEIKDCQPRAQTGTLLPEDVLQKEGQQLGEMGLEDDDEFHTEINRYDVDSQSAEKGHKPGGLPMMSDSLFSLIILVYVSVTFCIVFFLFCWKATNGRNGQLEFKQQCPLMTNEIREATMAEAKLLERNHSQIQSPTSFSPPTFAAASFQPSAAMTTMTTTTTMIHHSLPAVSEEDKETTSSA